MPEVRDMSAVAALVAWGHPIVDVMGDDFKIFKFSPEAEADLRAYYENAPIPARDFAQALKKIRAMVHDNR